MGYIACLTDLDAALDKHFYGRNGDCNYLDKLGFELLGQGACRQVYALTPDYVLKINRYQDGKYNRNEVSYACGRPLSIPITQPVRWSTRYTWLVAERAECTLSEFYRENRQASRFDTSEVVNLAIEDMHDSNMGLLKGRVVAIDYGFECPPGA